VAPRGINANQLAGLRKSVKDAQRYDETGR
jgi:hypothetical protein